MFFHDYWSLLNEAKPTLVYMGKHQDALADLREIIMRDYHPIKFPGTEILERLETAVTPMLSTRLIAVVSYTSSG